MPTRLPTHNSSNTAKTRAASTPARLAALTVVLLASLVTSCRDLPTAAPIEPATARSTPAPLAVGAVVNVAGRALAANCFQCHGTDGVAGELKIAGESASEIISELNEMRGKNPRSNIMNVHAAAYTPAEISLIATYFAQAGR